MPKSKPKKPELGEIATAKKDIDIFAGWIRRLENPDPVLRTESQGKGLKLYDEVDRDPHAGSVLQTRYLAVVGKEWNVEPATPVPGRGRPAAETREQKIADFVSEAFGAVNFDQARQELLQAILYGYYCLEVMWGYSEGQVWIEKLVAKHPRRFIFTPERDLRLLTPQNMIEGEEVPERKFVTFTYGSTDNPYGKGLGQKLWWPVWFKKHGIKFWVIFAEKFGSPTAVGKYPAGTTEDKQDDLLDAVEAIQQESGITIPEGMVIELLEAQRRSSIDTYEKLCEYMDRQISKAVLGQTATTEGTPGKLGSEEAREQVRQDIIKADADLLCEVLNNTLVRWLVDYNFPDVRDYPQMWIHTEEEEDLKALAERDKTLVKDIGLRVGEQYFYDTYSIPRPEEEDVMVNPPAPGPPGFAEGDEKKTPATAGERKAVEAQDRLDRLIEDKAREARPIIGNLTDHVRAAAQGAGSMGELLALVPSLYDALPSGPLIEHLADALMGADSIGAVSLVTEGFGFGSTERGTLFQEARWGPGTPFEEAIDYFRDRAFWISGIAKAGLLEEIKEEILRAIERGIGIGAFRGDLSGIFERRGYAPLNPWRIETIYRTNLQSAFQAGRERQMTEPAILSARPYWRYVAVRDAATRPEHMAMHGKVFRADSPVWDTWYPPNGFNCRCTVQTLSERELERNGWTVEAEDPTGRLFEPVDVATGAKLPARPLMPDPGWDRRPGGEDLRALLDERLAKLRS